MCYNKGDTTWRTRPRLMPQDTFRATLDRIAEHCALAGQTAVRITFHGGEPCLIGSARFDRWCEMIRRRLDGIDVHLTVQTNGVLLDRTWAEVLARHRVQIGISVDGPAELHDRARVDKRGRGSHARVVRGIDALRAQGLPFGLLCVVPLGADPLAVHHHLLGLGSRNLSYLLPDFTHDTVAEVRGTYGPTPCADFLIPIFDDWWAGSDLDLRISLFRTIALLIMGGSPGADIFGNDPLGFVVVESDGAIEDLDCLRVCADGITGTGLAVQRNRFADLAQASPLHRRFLLTGSALPGGCAGCPEATTCGGGYLPHRYSQDRGFDNPSVWCADLLAVFTHLRRRLDVPPAETALRRQVLREMAAAGRDTDVTGGPTPRAGGRHTDRPARRSSGMSDAVPAAEGPPPAP